MQGILYSFYSFAKPRGKTTGNTLAIHLSEEMLSEKSFVPTKVGIEIKP